MVDTSRSFATLYLFDKYMIVSVTGRHSSSDDKVVVGTWKK